MESAPNDLAFGSRCDQPKAAPQAHIVVPPAKRKARISPGSSKR